VHVGQEHKQPGELLAAFHDAELGALLDGVDRIRPGIGEADDLGLRALRLEQKRRHVGRGKRMAHLPDDLAAELLNDRLGLRFE